MFKQSFLSVAVAATLCVMPVQAQDKISGGVVKIGVLTDLSGLYMANVGPGSVLASKLAIEEFGGKVAGKPIELVVADHLNKADVAAARAREWMDRDGVDVVTEENWAAGAGIDLLDAPFLGGGRLAGGGSQGGQAVAGDKNLIAADG